MTNPAIRQTEDTIEIALHVQPRARRAGITGNHDHRIKVAVNAPAEAGKANRAVIQLFADALGIADRQIEIIRGVTSRRKDLRVIGVTLKEANERLLV